MSWFSNSNSKKLETCEIDKSKLLVEKTDYEERLKKYEQLDPSDYEYEQVNLSQLILNETYYVKYGNEMIPGKWSNVESLDHTSERGSSISPEFITGKSSSLLTNDEKYGIKGLYRRKPTIIESFQSKIRQNDIEIQRLNEIIRGLSVTQSMSGGRKYNRTRKNVCRKPMHKNLRKSKYHRK